jgi:hypothetical protein
MMLTDLAEPGFLGKDAGSIFTNITAGIVGCSGGGSHLAQQLAHLDVGNYVPVDHDRMEKKNLNRLVGATADDVVLKSLKTDIAGRVIKSIRPNARVLKRPVRWQEAMQDLRQCDIIFGCVDSFRERDQLERFARRFLIPYIDLGMDIHRADNGYSLGGQVVLSSPGGPCLWCLGILTHARLEKEAGNYGQVAGPPQVVWANGVLASLAVGLFVQLICPWHPDPVMTACCEFDGNRHRVEGNRMEHGHLLKCTHHPVSQLGDRFFTRPE